MDFLPARLSDDTVSLEQPSFVLIFWVAQAALATSYPQVTQHPRRHFHSGYADTPTKAAK